MSPLMQYRMSKCDLCYQSTYSYILYFFHRRCNGKRLWVKTAGIDPQPEYECSSFGQGHVETFDGLMYNFDNIGCR